MVPLVAAYSVFEKKKLTPEVSGIAQRIQNKTLLMDKKYEIVSYQPLVKALLQLNTPLTCLGED